MNNYMLILLFVLVMYMTIKNAMSYKKLKKNTEYVNCFNLVKAKDEKAYDTICEYLSSEEDECLANKTRLLKLFIELEREDDNYKSTVQEFDFKPILFENDEFKQEKVMENADSFVFAILCMAKARKMKYNDAGNILYDKIIAYEKECQDTVEFTLCVNVYKAIKSINDKGVAFFNNLINGEYTNYKYERKFIGSYKRIAASTLYYLNEQLSEYDREDLKVFATSFVGKSYMDSLDIKFEGDSEE